MRAFEFHSYVELESLVINSKLWSFLSVVGCPSAWSVARVLSDVYFEMEFRSEYYYYFFSPHLRISVNSFVLFRFFFLYKPSMYAKRSHRRFGRRIYCTEFLLLLSPIDVCIHNIYFCAKIEHVYSFILSGIFISAIVLFGFVLWTTNRNLKMQNRQSAHRARVCGALVCEWPQWHRWPIKSPSQRRQHYREAHPNIMSARDCGFEYSRASAMPW